jgi:hypothetical protein
MSAALFAAPARSRSARARIDGIARVPGADGRAVAAAWDVEERRLARDHCSGKKFDICRNWSYCGCWCVNRMP